VKWFRVDDRLIHGQVMVGWVLRIGIKEIILVNKEASDDPWMLEAYQMAVNAFAEDVNLCVVSTAGFCASNPDSVSKTLILISSIQDALVLYESGLDTSLELNLGGIHARDNRVKILSYLYLDSDEMEIILQLSRMGVKIIAQDLPNSKSFDVVKLLKQKGHI
jgi:mannose/fructose/N-acetylgalactosamine-specific phosphotransferase system component IIB